MTINGQTGGILPVLVFGAGTDYALLLVSRYREELRRHEDKHEADPIALKSAGPAIIASGLTVIAALLTLSLADVNLTAGLGPVGAVGIALAMLSMLTVLPALLAICGRRAFWSPGLDAIPHTGQAGVDETHGFWRGIGDRVATRPRTVWIAGTVVLLALAANLTNLDLTQTQGTVSRRGRLGDRPGDPRARLRGGSSAPTDLVVTDRGAPEQVTRRPRAFGDVRPGVEGDAAVQLALTLNDAPYSRAGARHDPAAPRGGRRRGARRRASAQESDLREAATRDNWLIIPLTLLVVFGSSSALLRALVAPVLLIASVMRVVSPPRSARGCWSRRYVFGFERLRARRCRCSRSCSSWRSASTTTSS